MSGYLLLFFLVQIAALAYIRVRFGMHFTLTSLLLISLITIHGAPFLIYMYQTGPDTFVYEAVLSHRNAEQIITRLLLAI
jgi:hypothetical protein